MVIAFLKKISLPTVSKVIVLTAALGAFQGEQEMNTKRQQINNLKVSDRLWEIYEAHRLEKELTFIINKELLLIKRRSKSSTTRN